MSRGCNTSGQPVASATVRCYAELNEHLPQDVRFSSFTVPIGEDATVAGILAGTGIPSSEVDLVLRNGDPASFESHVASGDRLSVYPVFETFDIGRTQHLRPRPLRSSSFVLDVHLGRLATFLRMLGFDSSYTALLTDEQLVTISLQEHRILLSKDRALLRDQRLERAYAVRSSDPRGQLLEVVKRFDLGGSVRPFTRCLLCNTVLIPTAKEAIVDRIPPLVRQRCDRFTTCPECHRVFWTGTHYERMAAFVAGVLRTAEEGEYRTSPVCYNPVRSPNCTKGTST